MDDPITRLEAIERLLGVGVYARHDRKRTRPVITESEASQPTYITYNPQTGQVVAQFNGVLTGSVILPEGTGAAQAASSLAWTDTGGPGGTIKEIVQGYFFGGQHVALISSRPKISAPQDVAQVLCITQPGVAGGSAVQVQVVDDVNNVGYGKNILQSDGSSAFPQLEAAGLTSILGRATRAYQAAAFNLVAAGAVLPFNTVDAGDDPGGHFNTGTGVFTAPVAGRYLAMVTAGSTAAATTSWMEAGVARNGAIACWGNLCTANAALQALSSVAVTILNCAANDTIGGFARASAALAGTTGKVNTTISVIQLN